MKATQIRGIVPPVITPLDPQGQVDVASLRRVVRRLIESGVHGLFALGSSGEVAYLDAVKRRLVLDTIIAEANGAVPVLAGCIDMTQQRVIEAVRMAEAAGADAVVVTAPFYAKNDMSEIADHFRGVAEATRLPVWAYDIPARVNVKLSARMLVDLGLEGVLAGVKDSSGDDPGFRRLVRMNDAVGHPLSVFSGHETVVDGMLLLGADGVVPGLANVDPERYVRLWNAAVHFDWASVRLIQDEIAALFEIVFQAPDRSLDAAGIGAFKAALHHLGEIEHATMAAPVLALDGPIRATIVGIVETVGVANSHRTAVI